ncbi:MAG: rRNA maturation RNase YbeY [Microscillaceae bacterium]|nr:rRNA maturation RNase YbeY [Microscillaceae bacterium]
MSKINFFNENLDFQPNHKTKLKRWIEQTIQAQKQKLIEINYIFCDDAYLHQINVEYLDHDTLTDIITFDNSETEGEIEADIFISIERVTENAQSFGVAFAYELHRVMIHGVFHLLGYGDKTEAEQKQMRQLENDCLQQLAI